MSMVQFEVECGRCPRVCHVRVSKTDQGVLEARGYGCRRGLDVANIEANRKRHAIKSYVKVKGSEKLLRVGLSRKVLDAQSPAVMKAIDAYEAELPVRRKQILIEHVGGTAAHLIALKSCKVF